MKNVGDKVRVYCAWCKRKYNGVLLEYDDNRSLLPYTVAVFGHHKRCYDRNRIDIEAFEEVEYADWRNAYEVEEEK